MFPKKMKLALLFLFFVCVNAIEEVDVVVVGAGITGISAGRTLKDQGKSFKILEAADRIGGRIHTLYDADTVNYPDPTEVGAAWVHDQYINDLYPVLLDLGVQMNIFDQADSTVWNNKGQSLSYNQISRMVNRAESIWTASLPFRRTGLSDADAIRLTGYAFDDPKVETYYEFAYEQWMGNNLEYHDSMMWDTSTTDNGPDHIIPAGYSSILDLFMDKVPAFRSNVQLYSKVTKIEYEQPNGKVKVTYVKPNGDTEIIQATKGVIVTVSINVIKSGSIEFVPALPNSHTSALNRLMCSAVNKVALYFDSVGSEMLNSGALAHNYMFRLGQENGGGVRQTDGLTCFINWKFVNGQAVVTSFYQGDFSRYMETLSDDLIITKHMNALRQFIKNLPYPVKYHITRWGTNPLTLCSYTDFATGSTLADLQQLAIPVGTRQNLHIAGEASNFPNQGTVHAGYLSGKSAANKLL